ncbi:MAG: hypothetical protein LBV67_10795 [Streptococcaceae bacterium]|jgi:hypothetical protein|nr:hypothetical protein [Streptococcaceae bacterium]
MLNLIISEITKCLKRVEFKVVVAATFAAVFLDFFTLCRNYLGADLSTVISASNATILTNQIKTPLYAVFAILLPLTVSLLYSDSYLMEKKLGLTQSVHTRISKKQDIIAKSSAVAIVSFLVTLFPLLINLALAMTAFPLQGYNTLGLPDYKMLTYIDSGKVLEHLHVYSPYLNLLIFILIRSLFAAAFALLSFGISFVGKINRYLVSLFSVVIYFVFQVVFDLLGSLIPDQKISAMLRGDLFAINGYGNLAWIIAGLVLFLGTGVVLITNGIRKEVI